MRKFERRADCCADGAPDLAGRNDVQGRKLAEAGDFPGGVANDSRASEDGVGSGRGLDRNARQFHLWVHFRMRLRVKFNVTQACCTLHIALRNGGQIPPDSSCYHTVSTSPYLHDDFPKIL